MKEMSLIGEIIAMIFYGVFWGLGTYAASRVLPIICGKEKK